MGCARKTICALALVTGLVAGVPALAEQAAPPAEQSAPPLHAPCTSMDLWGDLKAIIDTCEALIKSGKLQGDDLAEAIRHQGDAYFRSFRVDLAFENYKRALALKPDWPRALWNLGNAAGVLGYNELAIESEHRAAEVDPTYSSPHTAIGTFLANAGDPRNGLTEFDRALELDPKDYLARYNRALVYVELGRRLDALHDLDALLHEDEAAITRTYRFKRYSPEEDFIGDIQWQRATILRGIGSFDEALAALQSAIARRPGYADAVVLRSRLIREVSGNTSRFGEALSAIDGALTLHHDEPSLLAEKANLLVAMGNRRGALASLADSARVEPSADGEFFLERSYAWEALKDYDRAEADLVAGMMRDRETFAGVVQALQNCGYLMDWPGLDPNVAMANALAACVHDAAC